MNREEMLKRLEDWYRPIDVAIEKWKDLEKEWNSNDAISNNNCALCERYRDKNNDDSREGCIKCPLYDIGLDCITHNSPYRNAIGNDNAEIMLDALYKARDRIDEQECNELDKKTKKGEDKKEIELTYHIGQRFRLKGESEEYILARCAIDDAILISLDDGNWWTDSVKCRDSGEITKDEMKKIMAHSFDKFELIDEDC